MKTEVRTIYRYIFQTDAVCVQMLCSFNLFSHLFALLSIYTVTGHNFALLLLILEILCFYVLAYFTVFSFYKIKLN